jgi:hypothetical protein
MLKQNVLLLKLLVTRLIELNGLLLLLLVFGFKEMELVVLKNILVMFLHMMNVLLWFVIKDLMLMVLLYLLVVQEDVMLNLNKMVIMIVPLGKTSSSLLLFGFKEMELVVLKNILVTFLHMLNVLLWFMLKDLLLMVLLYLLVV